MYLNLMLHLPINTKFNGSFNVAVEIRNKNPRLTRFSVTGSYFLSFWWTPHVKLLPIVKSFLALKVLLRILCLFNSYPLRENKTGNVCRKLEHALFCYDLWVISSILWRLKIQEKVIYVFFVHQVGMWNEIFCEFISLLKDIHVSEQFSDISGIASEFQ